ncbi:hypothetical protein EZL74_12870 [Flavobacterium silvisoli]|uniref:Preprotein translocase subunit SecB n=1 Tax=Flavobacterium silvisoli TaxID=2529433 RepID=A0A4Q9YSB1_9FLAO|nr:hypothetical protein [Flavobacterium silvisoli]TBX64775.1 hypothetical protein EZL74_12870 [Flavobacterium silvisoli]
MVKAELTKAFNFKNFKVSKFSYDEPETENTDFDMEFQPKGRYNEKTGLFELYLTFIALDKISGNKIIKVKSVAEFIFDKPYLFIELPEYFFTNSIAIMFPYVRAFISTLTLQANANVLMLGLIKFGNVAEPLKENTEVISE